MNRQDAKHSAPLKVLAVAQTPPPFHGQAIMAQYLLDAQLKGVEMYHVRMAFSKEMEEVGRFRLNKVGHLLWIVCQIYIYRIRYGIRVLYYPPSGPKKISIYRDIVILLSVRWLFRDVVFHMHAGGVSDYLAQLSPITRWLAQAAYFHPTALVRLSEFTAADGEGLQAEREFIVPNGTVDDYPRFASQADSTDDKPCQLLFLSAVSEGKGILVLLESCQRLQQNGIPFHLHVVGACHPASFRDVLESQLTARNLQDHVTIYGQLTGDAKLQRLAEADIFCFPTHYPSESFPCVILEAMSFRLPVLSTRWRGIPAMVEHGVTGFMTPTEDVAAQSECLEELCQDASLRRRMGDAARERFLRDFTVDCHVCHMEKVFAALRCQADSNSQLNPTSFRVKGS